MPHISHRRIGKPDPKKSTNAQLIQVLSEMESTRSLSQEGMQEIIFKIQGAVLWLLEQEQQRHE